MKTQIKKITGNRILAIIIMVCFYASVAEGKEKPGQPNKESNISSVETSTSSEQLKLDETIEKSLKVEEWMYDVNYFEIEKSIQIEEWMSSTSFWSELEMTEKSIECEAWMSDINFWETEDKIQIEDWMSDKNFWNEIEAEDKVDVESWMYDTNFWNAK